ncbi:MAG: hypothetical protein J6W39_01085 [Spirochaetales bacterium]|nr:hypothetical protein [Spirochaetales bacterium]
MDRLFSYLNSLDDDYYFFVANTVLGKVQTPFHKPVINNAILSFLLNAENRANIVASLNQDDIRYLTLLNLVDQATSVHISDFFSSEIYPLVLTVLESLRDRLLVLKEVDSYFINPVLKDAVVPYLDLNLTLGENLGHGQEAPHVGKNVLFGILNLLSNGSIPPREANIHHFTKSDRLERVFPQFSKSSSLAFFSLIRAFLVSSGSVTPASGCYALNRDIASRILDLDDLNLMIACIGEDHALAVSKLLGLLKIHSLSKKQALCILSMFTESEYSDAVLSSMESFGFICISDNKVRLNSSVLKESLPMSKVNVDSDFEVTYFGEPNSTDILYLFADIEVCDNLMRYKITKDSFIRALDLGLDAMEISSYLGTARLDGQFSMWMQSYSRIRLYDGIVISCSKDVSSIVEKHPSVRPHIIANLGGGSFVMDRSPEWQQSLSYAMDLSRLPLAKAENSKTEKKVDFGSFRYSISDCEISSASLSSGSWENLRSALIEDALAKGCLTDDVKALIDARLIISKSQLSKGFRYAFMQTIGGFDYSVKLSAIKNLLRKKNPPLLKLELSDETILVQPVELMKGEGILKVRILPQCIEKSIAVSSIFKVTVMRWSMA